MSIKIRSFDDAKDKIYFVRNAVFSEEQQIPRKLDLDGRDPDCIHVLATDDEDRPIGTGRMLPDGRIGRLAVLKPWRGQGIGGQMLEALVETAPNLGIESVYLHSQTHAVTFYKKHGFKKDGAEFIEAGLPHITMQRTLTK